MNNEQDTHSTDEQVSSTYRELDNERVPEHLNRKILDQANRAVGRGNSIVPPIGSWTRPLALVATVVLSLAIVLEVTEVQENVSAPAASRLPAAPATDSLREDFTPKGNSVVEEAQNQARLRDGSNRNDSLIAEPQAVVESELRQQAKDLPTEVAETESADVAAPGRSTAMPSSSFSLADKKVESDSGVRCTADERETVEGWLACIEALRRSGAIAEADSEHKEFIQQFPAE
jgi:hypothetical protein